MPTIRLLPQTVINRIAAGEVLERPSSALKELVENALDADATRVEIEIEVGGKNLLRITDNGCGMSQDELQLAVQRHATSKLPEEDLFNINTFGFRGEAIPAIGSVAKLKITSKQDECWEININGGDVQEVQPSTMALQGTRVEVRDIFFATPARLKFMKADTTEKNKCVDAIKKIAMANEDVEFTLTIDGKIKLNYPTEGKLDRVARIIGKDFVDNALQVEAGRDEMSISGYAGLPTYNRGTSTEQYLYVNGRPVTDRILLGAIRAAYKDYLGGGRFPVLALFIKVPPLDVDVNVHPAKSEVRFKDQRNVTGMLISALRAAIDSAGHQASTTVADFALRKISQNTGSSNGAYRQSYYPSSYPSEPKQSTAYLPLENRESDFLSQPAAQVPMGQDPAYEPQQVEEAHPLDYPLGLARCQLHNTYIVSETQNSIVIVDQHAAHERLVYERYKSQIEAENLKKQPMLVPEIIGYDEKRTSILLGQIEKFARYGFEVQKFGTTELQISQIPALLSGYNLQELFGNIADDIIEHGEDLSLIDAFEHVLETSACHNSIRAGRRLGIDEMNAMLRQMETTPHSGQCNHGRPTYVELKLEDVEKLFGRR